MGKAPHGLAMAPDGKRLLATVYAEDRIGVWEPPARAKSTALPWPSRILDDICSVHPYMTGKVVVSAR